MTARQLAIGEWKAGEDKPTVAVFKTCARCGTHYGGDACHKCGNQHDNIVRGNNGETFSPWHLEAIYQEMEAEGELNPYPGDLDPVP